MTSIEAIELFDEMIAERKSEILNLEKDRKRLCEVRIGLIGLLEVEEFIEYEEKYVYSCKGKLN